MPRVVLAPDKFRGTADAAAVAAAMAVAAVRLGWEATSVPCPTGAKVCSTPARRPVPDLASTTGHRARRSSGRRRVAVRRRHGGGGVGPGFGAHTRRWARRQRPGGRDVAGDGGVAGGGRPSGRARWDRGGRTRGLGHHRRRPRCGARRWRRREAWATSPLVGACDVEATFVDAAARVRPAEGCRTRPGGGAGPSDSSSWPTMYRERYGVDVTDAGRRPAPPGAWAAALAVLGGRLRVGLPAGARPGRAGRRPGRGGPGGHR